MKNTNDNFFLFSPDACPFCGSVNLWQYQQSVKYEQLEELKSLQNYMKETLELLANFSPFLNTMGTSVLNRIGNKKISELPQFEFAWIYVKMWQERSWIALKWGKSIQPEKREKQYDDHDYILNLCIPVPKFYLNEYENFLKDYILNGLIPFVLEHKEERLKKILDVDFKSIKLKDGLAPDRNEYYRLYINVDSDEFKFLNINLITFFTASSRPGMPITFDEWIELKEDVKRQNDINSQKESQLSIFDEDEL